ncbi:MAG: hypothetical protein KDM91_04200 [Verrucomicrobiae bacterium]|nr:hypothetical protein [Verrucomicrobiae bacterium]
MKNESQPPLPTENRREFFATSARCFAVGGIAAFAAFQEIKRQRLVGDPNCIKLETCSDCIELSSGCRKDKAVEFRARRDGNL